MKISSWNLNGYKSRHFGSKLVHEDFLNEIGGSDIVGLTETHIHKEILSELHKLVKIEQAIMKGPPKRVS